MSTDYTQISQPNFTFGNNQDVHNQLINNLITDSTDTTNSKFLLANANSTQTVNTNFVHTGNHIYHGSLSINDDNDDNDNTDVRLAKKRWVRNYYQTLDHVFSGNDTFNQATINNLYCPNYINFQSGSDFHLNTPILIPDGAGGNNSLGTTKLSYLLNVNSDIQNQLNNKQNTITSSTNLTIGNLTSKSIIDNGSCTLSNGLNVTSGTITFPSGSISQSAINNLSTTLNNKVNLSNSLYQNTFYVNAGQNQFSDVLTSIGNLQSQCVFFSSGGHYDNNVLTTSTTPIVINNITSLTICAPDSAFTSASSVLYYPITIQGTSCTRILTSNINFLQPVIINGTLGRHTFKACTFSNNFSITGITTNWVNFNYCSFNGQLNIPNTYAGYCIFFSCDFAGCTLNLNNPSNQQIYFNSCSNLPSLSLNGLLEGFNTTVSSSAINTVSFNCTGSTTFGANSISQSSINGLSSALGSKQNTITSTTDLTLGNINCNQITCNGGEIDYSSFSVAGLFTINGNVSANSLTVTNSQIGFLSNLTSDVQTQINSKQNAINDNDLSISKTNGLQSALDAKASTIALTSGLATKQDTLTTGSITDSLLASTFIKANTAPILTGTNFSSIPQTAVTGLLTSLQYVDATSSIQTQLNSKQATLTTGSINDSLLASTFLKSNTDFTSGNITLGTNKNINGINAVTLNYLDATSSIQTQLNSKQSTLTNGSVSDSMLASTFIKPSTAPFLTGTNFSSIPQTAITGLSTTLQYLDATSSIQTQLNAKQSTLTNGSVSDSMLASTFIKPSTAPILTGTNFSSIPTSAISSGPLTLTVTTSNNYKETISSIGNNGTTNNYTLDFSTSSLFALTTAPTANFTVKLINCGSDTTKSINFALITNTKYYCSSVTAYSDNATTQITLSSATPLYAGAATPSISTATTLLQTFSLIRSFATNYVMSSIVPYQ